MFVLHSLSPVRRLRLSVCCWSWIHFIQRPPVCSVALQLKGNNLPILFFFYLNALCSYAKVSAQMSVFIYVAANEEALLTHYLESRVPCYKGALPIVNLLFEATWV